MKISANKVLTRNPKIRNTPPPPPPQSESLPISGDWDKLGIPNLAGLSLTKCYRMLQNVMVTAFTVAEVLREKTQRGWGGDGGGRGMNEINGLFLSYTEFCVKLDANPTVIYSDLDII